MASRQARIAELTRKLAEQGYRITPQRLAVMGALVDAPNHPSAEDLFARVRETCPTTSLATVYKTLDTLKEIGEVLELEFRDGSNRYDGVRPQPLRFAAPTGSARAAARSRMSISMGSAPWRPRPPLPPGTKSAPIGSIFTASVPAAGYPRSG